MNATPILTIGTNLNSKDILFGTATIAEKPELFVGSSDAKLYSVDLSSEKPERIPFEDSQHTSYITDLVSTTTALVSCSYDRQLCWWDVEKRTLIRAVQAHDKWIRRLAVSPDGQLIASVEDDM